MKPNISFFFEDIDTFSYPGEKLIEWISRTIQGEIEAEIEAINIIFCSDTFLLEINNEYLKHDYFTDIITFEYSRDPLSGDLFISIDRVRENSLSFSYSFDNELNRVIIHGILHLCGYGDKSEAEAKTMRSKEDFYLGILNEH